MTDHPLSEAQRFALTTVLNARDLAGGMCDDANLERRALRIAQAITMIERALSPTIIQHLTAKQIAAIERQRVAPAIAETPAVVGWTPRVA